MLLRKKTICSYDHGVAVTVVDFSLEEEEEGRVMYGRAPDHVAEGESPASAV